MIDRTQTSDRPSRRIFTGLAIAAGGGVIALLVEYFVIQGWLAPEPAIQWKSNNAPKPVNSVSAEGKVEHVDGWLTVTGNLTDNGHDNKGVLLIFSTRGGDGGRVANTDGANQSVTIDKGYPDTVPNIAVQECLTHQKRAMDVLECSDPLVIWPKP
ncbi:hypothetical protein [Saccharopolyspora dendranthemae]|uniref:Uncharacterized protein n=1 Tax=Saccharopolyspora dendranthemae TaxID=1181886 RepID=A0A561TZQ1_9PSEU|nr:hypothetical protein [Saccharopolyspora dendranthemae]TWF92593.1 hypothetical protein FHU35_17236 [Saccharopolyspora dendranthemae]